MIIITVVFNSCFLHDGRRPWGGTGQSSSTSQGSGWSVWHCAPRTDGCRTSTEKCMKSTAWSHHGGPQVLESRRHLHEVFFFFFNAKSLTWFLLSLCRCGAAQESRSQDGDDPEIQTVSCPYLWFTPLRTGSSQGDDLGGVQAQPVWCRPMKFQTLQICNVELHLQKAGFHFLAPRCWETPMTDVSSAGSTRLFRRCNGAGPPSGGKPSMSCTAWMLGSTTR